MKIEIDIPDGWEIVYSDIPFVMEQFKKQNAQLLEQAAFTFRVYIKRKQVMDIPVWTRVRVTDMDNKIYIATKNGWIEEERKECEE